MMISCGLFMAQKVAGVSPSPQHPGPIFNLKDVQAHIRKPRGAGLSGGHSQGMPKRHAHGAAVPYHQDPLAGMRVDNLLQPSHHPIVKLAATFSRWRREVNIVAAITGMVRWKSRLHLCPSQTRKDAVVVFLEPRAKVDRQSARRRDLLRRELGPTQIAAIDNGGRLFRHPLRHQFGLPQSSLGERAVEVVHQALFRVPNRLPVPNNDKRRLHQNLFLHAPLPPGPTSVGSMLSFAVFAAVVSAPQKTSVDFVGTWTTKVQFVTGAFASVKDLEFMMVINREGTMTESSNYDGAPPVPPADGIWRKTGTRKYEAKYVFYQPNPPAEFKTIQDGGGWMPAGKGILIDKITLAPNGQTYKSEITMKMFDSKGKVLETSKAVANGVRMKF